MIDPVIEWADRDKTIVEELGLKLKYARELPGVDHYLARKFRGLKNSGKSTRERNGSTLCSFSISFDII